MGHWGGLCEARRRRCWREGGRRRDLPMQSVVGLGDVLRGRSTGSETAEFEGFEARERRRGGHSVGGAGEGRCHCTTCFSGEDAPWKL